MAGRNVDEGAFNWQKRVIYFCHLRYTLQKSYNTMRSVANIIIIIIIVVRQLDYSNYRQAFIYYLMVFIVDYKSNNNSGTCITTRYNITVLKLFNKYFSCNLMSLKLNNVFHILACLSSTIILKIKTEQFNDGCPVRAAKINKIVQALCGTLWKQKILIKEIESFLTCSFHEVVNQSKSLFKHGINQ